MSMRRRLLAAVPLALVPVLALALAQPWAQAQSTTLAQTPSSSSTPLKCLSLGTPSTIPARLPVGVETIHRDADKIITVFVPLAPNGAKSRILDSNAKSPPIKDQMPERFVMSDGSVQTAFIGVDVRPGSKLDACLKEILARLPDPKPEAVAQYIRDHLQDDYLKAPSASYVFDWDKKRKGASEALMEVFHSAKDMAVGQYPIRSKETHETVPLEKFIEAGYGTCLHKALLASLILKRLGIAHRLVNGANHANGHSWIELSDGRILDPSLKRLEKPEPSKAFAGWIKYGDNVVFEDQVWPYLALD